MKHIRIFRWLVSFEIRPIPIAVHGKCPHCSYDSLMLDGECSTCNEFRAEEIEHHRDNGLDFDQYADLAAKTQRYSLALYTHIDAGGSRP